MNSLRAIGTAFLVTSFCFLSHFRADGADLTAAYQWKQMKIGDGEWIVDMDTSPTEKGVIFVQTPAGVHFQTEPIAPLSL